MVFFLIIFVVAALVLLDAVEQVILQDSQHQEQPEHINGLETSKQSEGDVLRDPALVLLSFPVQFKWTYSTELSQGCPKDSQIEVVSKVDPNTDKYYIKWSDDDRVQVVQRFGGLDIGVSHAENERSEKLKHTARKKSLIS
jgi:hypothetical protein